MIYMKEEGILLDPTTAFISPIYNDGTRTIEVDKEVKGFFGRTKTIKEIVKVIYYFEYGDSKYRNNRGNLDEDILLKEWQKIADSIVEAKKEIETVTKNNSKNEI